MKQFTVHKGLVAPMDRENVDTDAIIPKQFLKSIKQPGLAMWQLDLAAGQTARVTADYTIGYPKDARLQMR